MRADCRSARVFLRARPIRFEAMRRWIAELRALVVPPLCAACGAALPAADEVLCRGCRAGLPWLPRDRCPRCALPSPCSPCPASASAFAAAWAPLAHQGTARTVVGALKFHARFALADAMAAQLAAGAPRGLLDGATLVPVPPAPSRRRRRGYDHADLLARALARRTGLPVVHPLRRASGPRQLGAGRTVRLASGRLEIRAKGRVPSVAALVDDVHTTGATLDACARALRDAGAERVVAVTYTRTLRR
jgi:predicted amidophosphoribosyltransferase